MPRPGVFLPGRAYPRPSPGVLLVALLVPLIAVTACGGSAPPSPSVAPSIAERCDPDEVAAGGINGIVVDVDGNPLEDIFIQLDSGEFTGSARTGPDGRFTAPGVSGEFVITTVDLEYAEATRRVTVACGELVDVELVLTRVEE